ncbi:hypothetical protein [Diplocloster agilis]|nr:hypothetical protein [Suonthocola fibrivorans]MCU6734452.1 hypothetical protein [Suonthocola fibrivorans]
MQMVNEYFDRTYDECKTEYDRQLEMLNQYRRQLEDIHKMMEFEKTQEDNESRIFSPYEEDHFNQENYEKLVEEESEVLIQIQELEIEVLNWKSKLESLREVQQQWNVETNDLKVKNKSDIINKLEYCIKLVDVDPVRCKLEMKNLLKLLKDL